jgi:AbrB family looped-hinge helix DNA binding protein
MLTDSDTSLSMCHMATYAANMNDQGRVVIPAPIRKKLDLEGPVKLLFHLKDGGLTVETVEGAVSRVQEMVAAYSTSDESAVDDLIAQRRAEAAREW